MLVSAPIALLLAFLPPTLLVESPALLKAQPDSLLLTWIEARALALDSSPRALAIRAEGAAAQGAARTDRVYPFNPTAELKGAEALDPGGTGSYEAIFSQEIEWAGQWFVRRSAGDHAATAARMDETNAIRTFLLEVDRAFFRLRAAEEAFRVSTEGAELARSLREAVQARFREGAISSLEMNLTVMEAGLAEARGLASRNSLAGARQAFRDVLGVEADVAVRTMDPGPTAPQGLPMADAPAPPQGAASGILADSLVALALARRPDLLAARAREEEADSRRRLASRTAIPNVDLGAVVDRSSSDADVTYGLRIAFPIPLWNRNQGEREQTRALEERARALTRDVEMRVRGEVLTALDAYRTATEELQLFEATVLEPARENRDLLQRAFDLGQMDLPTVLLLQTQQIQSEIAYWESWLRQREALADLEAAVGAGGDPGAMEG